MSTKFKTLMLAHSLLLIASCSNASEAKFHDPLTQEIYDRGMEFQVQRSIASHEKSRKENNLSYPERTPSYVKEVRNNILKYHEPFPISFNKMNCLLFLHKDGFEIMGVMPVVCFDSSWKVVEYK